MFVVSAGKTRAPVRGETSRINIVKKTNNKSKGPSRDRFKTPPPGIETLERLKRWPSLKRRVMQDAVKIYSGEHGGFWREGARGYTDRDGITKGLSAWVLPLEDALKETIHCGPEKRIEFHSLF